VTKPVVRKLRCAVYTRKSSEEGLEQEFNSLHAQREACEAYIASQRSEGWVLVRDRYDDGGVSGGTLERPGLQRLLSDIEEGLVDVVVVYKIDRLSRSLADFAKLVEVFERKSVTFVSVTQSFNTTTSMGRLTLNILLSFAQFEREVTAERIRDKFAASRKKGMWMGGVPPYGYRVENRRLVIDDERAEHVRWIFTRFLEVGSGTVLAREVGERGIRTPSGNRVDKKYLYRMLNNRANLGEAVHKGESYPGEHEPIIDRETWDRVHAIARSPKPTSARRCSSWTRCGTSFSRRAGADRGVARRAGRHRHEWAPGPASRGRPERPGVRDAGQRDEDRRVTRGTPTTETVTLHVPFRVVKRGGRKEMQLPESAAPPRRTDSTLVKPLARAFRWKRMLESGEFATIAELAEREGIAPSYMTRVLRLTLLAPNLVEAILDGREGPEVTLQILMQGFPEEWSWQTSRLR